MATNVLGLRTSFDIRSSFSTCEPYRSNQEGQGVHDKGVGSACGSVRLVIKMLSLTHTFESSPFRVGCSTPRAVQKETNGTYQKLAERGGLLQLSRHYPCLISNSKAIYTIFQNTTPMAEPQSKAKSVEKTPLLSKNRHPRQFPNSIPQP